ncbi:HAD family hydrolase [Plantibacter sp. lyk4-40-MEA-4]|uniref:HAD family hydrolase n=1 Tax=Plantibacter sp. lyk4-40-MEA-4 TaxID=3040298 RepID=UPI0025502B30|nr:HAD family hydrolase [Plantibacter sp. lyk4-40-MEA-4]
MPPPLNSQNVIAFIWDFDKTLTPGYMQQPIFEAYGVNASTFWQEVNALVEHYQGRELQVSKDTAYLGHMLTYIDGGPFDGLTNARLRELGAGVPLAPGMPEFMDRMRSIVANDERFAHHELKVEHYIVSTGLRQMIEGNPIRRYVDGVWACELLSDPPAAGYLQTLERLELNDKLTQVGYALDNTTKTRAVFEINKGSNVEPSLDVNARMDPDERRVPLQHMIYVADGPSDVPVFSVVGGSGGRTLGVWTDSANYANVKQLQDDGRVNSIAKADFSEGSEADMWLTATLRSIAKRICDTRDRRLASIAAPGGHVV